MGVDTATKKRLTKVFLEKADPPSLIDAAKEALGVLTEHCTGPIFNDMQRSDIEHAIAHLRLAIAKERGVNHD